MCGRYVSPEQSAIERAWRIGRYNGVPFECRFNVQPSAIVPFLRRAQSGERELITGRWGLIPAWWKQAKPPRSTFNARIEEAAAKPMWRHAFRHARCLIPAQGWYEWRESQRTDPDTGEIKAVKQPYYVRRRDESLFCFAGLMSLGSQEGEGEPQASCAILTTSAAGPAAELHDRMPVVLADEGHAMWLDSGVVEPGELAAVVAKHLRPDAFEHYAVSTLVNNNKMDEARLIEPIEGSTRNP